MFVELHMIQSFAPANLNRDDTGAPKDCEFGGYRRARISSQSFKRAMRETFRDAELIPADQRAIRTKRVVGEIAGRLADDGRDRDQAGAVVEAVLGGLGIDLDENTGKTQYLLYLGAREIDQLTDLCRQNWDALAAIVPGKDGAPDSGRRTGREAKKAGKAAVPADVRKAAIEALDGGRAVDLALFGRMLADLPERNVDAATQVAHAISTNRVNMEFDFYTAVDDLRPQDTEGADMLGTVEFNAACFYRYLNVDLTELRKNLGGDDELVPAALAAFLRAAITAVPSGKQHSMAAQNPPSLVMAVVRDRGLWSLTNAFAKPITPGQDGDLVQRSIAALDDYWGKLTTMYGTGGIAGTWVATLDGDGLRALAPHRVDSVNGLIGQVLASATSRKDGAA